jgi:ribose transport system permease protein
MFSVTMAKTYLGLFTARSVLFLVGAVLLQIWLKYTVPGRNLFALGSNTAAAEASGIGANTVLFWSFVFAAAWQVLLACLRVSPRIPALPPSGRI